MGHDEAIRPVDIHTQLIGLSGEHCLEMYAVLPLNRIGFIESENIRSFLLPGRWPERPPYTWELLSDSTRMVFSVNDSMLICYCLVEFLVD